MTTVRGKNGALNQGQTVYIYNTTCSTCIYIPDFIKTETYIRNEKITLV